MTDFRSLCGLPATEARRLIGERRLSPVDLLEACIAQIEAVNPQINAVVTKSYERARLEANEAERAVSEGRSLGLLHGLPALIKDLNETKDIRTTFASPLYKDHVPTSDDPVVARLRDQGAIIVGKTNTPEFGVGIQHNESRIRCNMQSLPARPNCWRVFWRRRSFAGHKYGSNCERV